MDLDKPDESDTPDVVDSAETPSPENTANNNNNDERRILDTAQSMASDCGIVTTGFDVRSGFEQSLVSTLLNRQSRHHHRSRR